MDRSQSSVTEGFASFYTLLGLRQDRIQRGRIEQSPNFALKGTKSAGSYYNGGTLTEPNTAKIIGAIKLSDILYISDYTVHYGGNAGTTQAKIFYQTVTTTGTGLNSGCYVVINSVAGLALNLNGSLDIVIDAAATFKWRKNGGAYTLGVPITTSGVSIDGGNATVYFLTATGFTVNDTWSWTRTDWTQNETGTYNSTTTTKVWTTAKQGFFRTASVYGTGVNLSIGRIMQVIYDMNGVPYCVSVGYRPVYGQGMCLFANHLFVYGYNTTGVTPDTNTIRTLAWSDLNDYNNFISTDTNEADTLVMSTNIETDSPAFGTINEAAPLGNELIVYTSMGTFSSPYLGLPTVFSFQQISPFKLNGSGVDGLPDVTLDSLVVTPRGHYIQRYDGLWFFDGSGFRLISDKFPFASFGTSQTVGGMTYDDRNQEVFCYRYGAIDGTTDGYILCYQERYDTFYLRWAGLGTTSPYVWSIWVWQGVLYVGVSDRRVCVEDTDGNLTPIFDKSSGTVYGAPTLVTNLVGSHGSVMKDIDASYIIARSQAVASSTYSVAGFLTITLSWAPVNSGYIEDASFVSNALAVWTGSSTDGALGYPRTNFRFLTFKLVLTGTDGTKPPRGAVISGFEADIRGLITSPDSAAER